jgi:hypothetical protein
MTQRITGTHLTLRHRPAAVAAVLASALALAGGAGLAQAAPQSATPGEITTAIGGVGGPGAATDVPLGFTSPPVSAQPCAVAFSGALYVADGVLRKINVQTDHLTTQAGTFANTPIVNGSPPQGTGFDGCGVTADHNGNLIVTDQASNLVRVIAATTGTFYGQAMTAGNIYTIAGGGHGLFGVPALTAALFNVGNVTVDSFGNVVFVENGGFESRGAMVVVVAATTGTFYKVKMVAGDIYRLAGIDRDKGGVFGGDGGPARASFVGTSVGELAVDPAGNLVLADGSVNRVRVIAAKSARFYGQAMTGGDIYTIAGNGTAGFAGDGGPAAAAEFDQPNGLALDRSGNLVMADTANNRLRVVAAETGTFYGQAMTAGDVYTVAGTGTAGFAGDGGPAGSAELSGPVSVALDGSGNLVADDEGNQRIRVVAAGTGTFYAQPMTAQDIYTVAGNGQPTPCCPGFDPAKALLQRTWTVATDPAGDTFVSDADQIQMVAGATGTRFGQPMTAGLLYTVATAAMDGNQPPTGIATDTAGNLVLAIAGLNEIRVVAATTGTFYGQAMTAGQEYRVAGTGMHGRSGDRGPAIKAELNTPEDMAVDHTGNLVIADTANSEIRVVAARNGTFYGRRMTAGDIYVVAGQNAGFGGDGGPARAARIARPFGEVVDAAGNLVISDSGNARLRVIAASTGTFYGQAMTANDIYTVAGDGGSGFSGDGGPATSAEISPQMVAVDGAGNLALVDDGSNRVRVVAEATGTFYGKAMTTGDIYTVAGDGTFGFTGDGGPATAAELNQPDGVAVNRAGDLLIADVFNNRIREVAR